MSRLLACLVLLVAATGAQAQAEVKGQLEIHYINVGQGGSTLIVGPNGTAILYDFGDIAGNQRLVPYLQALPAFRRRRTIDYAVISHADRDHFVGYRDLVESGFQIIVANFEPGTDKTGGMFEQQALRPARDTVAGDFRPIAVGLAINLGDGARATVVAANGVVMGEPVPRRSARARLNENDRSISLFIDYGGFQFLIDGDLGSGKEPCTEHETNQRSIQPRVARALLEAGLITQAHGVDVLHIAHHGSQSSTSAAYYNDMKPEVGIISVGPKQRMYRHPRKSVVENVLTCATKDGVFSPTACTARDTRAKCVEAPPLKGLFQTDNGNEKDCPAGDPQCVSYLGLAGGNIVLRTNGKEGYTVSVDGSHLRPTDKKRNVRRSSQVWSYDLDTGNSTERVLSQANAP